MDEQLYLMGLGLSLEEKVEKAIATLRHYVQEALKRDPVGGFYLCDSYGKDSCVILELAKMSGVKFVAHHNHTTLDPPELIWFGRKHHGDTVVHKPKMPMLHRLTIRSNGPPTRLSRWCCEEYKEGGGTGTVKVLGVRAAESARRKAQWKVWQPDAVKNGAWRLNPILYWSDKDIWQFIRKNSIPYCRLYDEGLDRLGCIGCPMAGDKRKIEFERWPKHEAMWQRSFQKFWANWHGVERRTPRWVEMEGKYQFHPLPGERTETRKGKRGFLTLRRWYDLRGFRDWRDLWQWWLEELPEPDDDDCQMGLF